MSFSVFAGQAYHVHSEAVYKKAAVIERKATRNKYFLAGLTALGHAQNIYTFWPVIKSFLSDDCLVQTAGPLCEGCQVAQRAAKEFSFTKAFSNFSYNTKQILTTSQGWLSIGEAAFSYFGQLSAMFIMYKTVESLTHPDTLRWYVRTYTPYYGTITEMKKAIERLQSQSIDDKHVQYNEQLLSDSLDRLAHYGESICAYMIYKTKKLEVQDRPVTRRLAKYFYNYYNKWLSEVSEYSKPGHLNYAEISRLIGEYENEIPSQLTYFAVVEHETKSDRRAVAEKE